MKNPIVKSFLIVTCFWWLVSFLASQSALGELFISAAWSVQMVVVGVVCGSATALVLAYNRRLSTTEALAPSALRGMKISLGRFPSAKKAPSRVRVRGRISHPLSKAFEGELAQWWGSMQSSSPLHADILRGAWEIMAATPVPASPVPGGHGDFSLLEHSHHVLDEMVRMCASNQINTERSADFEYADPNAVLRQDDPILPVVAYLHDIGKLVCYKPTPAGVKEVRPNHGAEGGWLVLSMPEFWALPKDDRDTITLALTYYHEHDCLPKHSPDRVKLVIDALTRADIAAGEKEAAPSARGLSVAAPRTEQVIVDQPPSFSQSDILEILQGVLIPEADIPSEIPSTNQAPAAPAVEPVAPAVEAVAGTVVAPAAEQASAPAADILDSFLSEPPPAPVPGQASTVGAQDDAFAALPESSAPAAAIAPAENQEPLAEPEQAGNAAARFSVDHLPQNVQRIIEAVQVVFAEEDSINGSNIDRRVALYGQNIEPGGAGDLLFISANRLRRMISAIPGYEDVGKDDHPASAFAIESFLKYLDGAGELIKTHGGVTYAPENALFCARGFDVKKEAWVQSEKATHSNMIVCRPDWLNRSTFRQAPFPLKIVCTMAEWEANGGAAPKSGPEAAAGSGVLDVLEQQTQAPKRTLPAALKDIGALIFDEKIPSKPMPYQGGTYVLINPVHLKEQIPDVDWDREMESAKAQLYAPDIGVIWGNASKTDFLGIEIGRLNRPTKK